MIWGMAVSRQSGARGAERVLVWLAVAAVALMAVGMVISLLAGGAPSTSPDQVPPWRENLSFAVVVLALVLLVAGLVAMVRAQVFTTIRLDRARALGIGQRRQMGRWIRRGQTPPPAMAGATTLSAQVLVDQRKSALFYVGFVLLMVGAALGAAGLRQLAYVVFAAVMVVGMVLVARDAHLAQRWLDAHREPATGHSATT